MLISFRDYFNKIQEEKELQNINESVINKIKHLFLLKSPDKIVDEFRRIFDINDDIKISKVDMGGSFNPYTKNITYSTNNSLIHELIHYLQNRNKDTTKDYTVPEFTDEGILKYILQPLELNNWALSFADDAFQYGGLNNFLKIISRRSDNIFVENIKKEFFIFKGIHVSGNKIRTLKLSHIGIRTENNGFIILDFFWIKT